MSPQEQSSISRFLLTKSGAACQPDALDSELAITTDLFHDRLLTLSISENRFLIIASVLPPIHDAIGEYSAQFASALATLGQSVELLTSCSTLNDPVPGVSITTSFDIERADFARLEESLSASGLAAAILQYNPFSWGRRGWAPQIVRALERSKRKNPRLTLGVMFHEIYMMNPGLRSWIMRQWQRRQFNQLVRLADVSFISSSRWRTAVEQAGGRAVHLPVGSNLPTCPPAHMYTRSQLGIDDKAFVCGALGSTHLSRPWSWIGAAVQLLQQHGFQVVVLYFGTSADDLRKVCGNVPVLARGRLDASEASAHFGAMDLFLSPFQDGLSTRRSSVMAALQHGIATVSTHSAATDPIFMMRPPAVALSDVHEKSRGFAQLCLDLASDPARRRAIAAAGQSLYQSSFDWPLIASRLVGEMDR